MTRDRNILRDLLLRDISAAQLVVYAIGSYLGLLILTGALQLWRDFSTSPDGSSDDPFASEDYVIFSPKVKGLGFGAAQGLPDTLLTTLNSQPWVVSADRFSAADFSVTVSADFGGDRLASALFFESVPDGYLQPLPDSWAFDPYGPDSVTPIILPRDYLALYNFGFAPSRGFPSLGEEVVMHIPLSVHWPAWTAAGVACAYCRFSNRINTISVPEAFLQWANKNFGDVRKSDGSSSRIIAHISVEASDPLVRDFAESHDLDIAGDDGNASLSRILSVILAIVMGVGAILCTLSVVHSHGKPVSVALQEPSGHRQTCITRILHPVDSRRLRSDACICQCSRVACMCRHSCSRTQFDFSSSCRCCSRRSLSFGNSCDIVPAHGVYSCSRDCDNQN